MKYQKIDLKEIEDLKKRTLKKDSNLLNSMLNGLRKQTIRYGANSKLR